MNIESYQDVKSEKIRSNSNIRSREIFVKFPNLPMSSHKFTLNPQLIFIYNK